MLIILALFALLAVLTPTLTKLLKQYVFVVLAAFPLTVFIYTAAQFELVTSDQPPTEWYPWVSEIGLSFAFRLDLLSWVMALVVTGIGAIVLLYCAWYFRATSRKLSQFATLLFLFAGVMYGLVISDDIVMMFIFWEITSVLSYLLIGHYNDRKESRGAAMQALLVTTLGGLAMLVGIVLLMSITGTGMFSELAGHDFSSPAAITAMVLILSGAFSKAALIPTHFWLPAAMAAPTPVSAYLHAAAMVKAGIYLIARIAPIFAATPAWKELMIVVGIGTMLVGGWRAMRQYDLKLVLAYGTISQLGFITVIIGSGTFTLGLAGLALLLAHALYKATLFLIVGVIDLRAKSRDLRQLSGIARKAPILAAAGFLSVFSMIGLPPMFGFVAKEAALAGLISSAESGGAWDVIALIGVVVGSVLTTAYGLRFLWGAFAKKPEAEDSEWHPASFALTLPAVLLTVLSVGAGLAAGFFDTLLQPFAAQFPGKNYHLQLWHGFGPELWLSLLAIGIGIFLFWQRRIVSQLQALMPQLVDSAGFYWASIRGLNRGSVWVTDAFQRTGLPRYLTTILLTFIAAVVVSLAGKAIELVPPVVWDYPAQLIIAVVIVIGAIGAAAAQKRLSAILFVGITGFGVVAIFALQGAPDLALTQGLVELITIASFVLVLRRLPSGSGSTDQKQRRVFRAIIGTVVGISVAVVGYIALGARIHPTISEQFPALSLQGHGLNIVNVTLVDIRAWDTMGEISVLVAVATGIASLVFITGRNGMAPRIRGSKEQRKLENFRQQVVEPVTGSITVISSQETRSKMKEGKLEARQSWLMAGRTLSAKNRSIILEVVVRLLFHPIIMVSVFLLFVGHNAPGGGFAGGLVAGLALVARYLVGGRYELGEAAPIDAGKLMGAGIFLAVGTAVSSLLLDKTVFEASWFELDIPVLGELTLGTPFLFDLGVYLVVVGLVLDILRSLGAEIDRQQEEEENGDTIENSDAKAGVAS